MFFLKKILVFVSVFPLVLCQEALDSDPFLIVETNEAQLKEWPVEEEEVQLQCTSWRVDVEANNLSPWEKIPEECADYVKEYMIGKGYELDLQRVSHEAKAFARSVYLSGDGNSAWIFDVDETLLSNLPYYAQHGFGLEVFDSAKFGQWVEMGIAPAIESSLELYEEVLSLGFKVILLTGRSERHRSITVENLFQAGFREWDKLLLRLCLVMVRITAFECAKCRSIYVAKMIANHQVADISCCLLSWFLVSQVNVVSCYMMSSEDHEKTATVYKSEKRSELVEQGYQILGNSGDQWSDLLGSSMSIRSFKLPNPIRRKAEHGSGDVESAFECKEGDGRVNTEDLIKFHGGEDLTVEEILDAPGEVIGKSSYGTLYRASLVNSDSLALLRFLRPTCTLRIKEGLEGRSSWFILLWAWEFSSVHQRCDCPCNGVRHFLKKTFVSVIDGKVEAHKWPVVYRISVRIARGVRHLHTAFEKPIIHGNLKSKNIFLDRHLNPYISDFGLNLLLNPTAGQQMLESSASQGYKAPELMKMKDASKESDIYSLGVIFLELLTGKLAIDENSTPDQDFCLPGALRNAVLDDQMVNLYHPDILLGLSNDQRIVTEDRVLRFFQLAMACCSPTRLLRPDINQILEKLQEIGK
ncbi:UNVERIFIED_CONTAM: Acid phosphatase 1 [Sesamum calycinum]|uniref:Acid phosphatase 1 n=1 Tax=Sesamum calycinum TaxID=2727403 RepID=A0AAW2RS91_9LAMI